MKKYRILAFILIFVLSGLLIYSFISPALNKEAKKKDKESTKIVENQEKPKPAPESVKPKVDTLGLVRKTIRGDFGNGQARVEALGENYAEVQQQVNKNIAAGNYNWDQIKLY